MGLRDRIRAQVGGALKQGAQVLQERLETTPGPAGEGNGLRARLTSGLEKGLMRGLEKGIEQLGGTERGGSAAGMGDPATARRGNPARAGQGPLPRFADAGDNGLDAWMEQAPRLEEVGAATVALFQSQLVASELALRDALDELEALARTRARGESIAAWRTVCESLATLWQEQNARIMQRWGDGFQSAGRAWREAGRAVQDRPWPDALTAAAAAFDKTWLTEWENFQGLLEDIAQHLKKGFEAGAVTPQLQPGLSPQSWQRALSLVDGGIRRAQGDLWGAWGTEAALLRGYSRKVNEGEGTLRTLHPPAFDRMTQAFDTVIRANVADLRDSWLDAVKVLRLALQAMPPV